MWATPINLWCSFSNFLTFDKITGFEHIAATLALPLELLRGCSTDGPDCESSREYEGQDVELREAARTYSSVRFSSGNLF